MDEWAERLAGFGTGSIGRVVEGLLGGMGYVLVDTPADGRDVWQEYVVAPARGGDDAPRLIVGVARDRDSEVEPPELEAFVSGRESSDRGMYVSLAGFAPEAREQASELAMPVILLEPTDLAERLRSHWGALDGETQALVEGRG
ncbi:MULTISPECIES: restriction endonuclease [unclassified Thioalkalivibrio]|uniref:restriction endonuclease n=1 Tax=unclassified Thioalkalivibrio TaxID=2621013 RepID=UPI000380BEE0|nr:MULTISPECIES: restriction endonuclease [unclassified Thioalkalivibrio]